VKREYVFVLSCSQCLNADSIDDESDVVSTADKIATAPDLTIKIKRADNNLTVLR